MTRQTDEPIELWRIRGAAKTWHEFEAQARAQRVTVFKLVKEARNSGASLRQIAEASGLSFQRVHQIIKKEQGQ